MSRTENQMIEEIDVLEFLHFMLSRWKLFLAATLISAALAFGISKLLPKIYEAKATIYVQEGSKMPVMLKDLVGLSSSGSTTTNYLVTLLESETMSRNVVTDLRLMSNPDFAGRKTVTEDGIVQRLKKSLEVKDNSKGKIDIRINTTNPQLSSDIVNSALHNLGRLMITTSQQKADFIRGKMDQTNVELRKAEDEALVFQKKNQITELDTETQAMIKALVEVDKEMLDLDVQLEGTSSELNNAGELNSLVDLEVRKKSLEASRSRVAQKKAELEKKLTGLPVVALEYARLKRHIEMLNKTYELLAGQYQLASISQYGEDGDYQIIDRAHPEIKPVSPRKLLNTAFGAMLGFMIALALSFPSYAAMAKHRA